MSAQSERPVPYVFLSYASADRERALRIADLLESHGVSVWIDRKSIAGGTSWTTEIVEGLQRCTALVLLWSTGSAHSRNVQQEIQLAWESNRPILPLLLDRVDQAPAMRYALAGRQWVEILDRPDDAWLPDVLRALRGMGAEAQPAPPTNLTATSSDPPIAETAPIGVAEPPPHDNLPTQTTSFIGRERELAEIRQLLLDPTSPSHLITLTGAGGCGKTRLALQVASTVLDDFADGVWLVELAPLTDPILVAQTVAQTLGIRESAGVPLLQTLVTRLRSKSLLLVLDNCEHLIEVCAQLADALIRGCPHLRVLATSRELLGVAGETARQLHPLPGPDLRTAPTTPQALAFFVRENEASRLFVDRARLVVPAFEVTAENAAFVAQICQRLDGIPLALELAAARLRVLPVEQIAARLNDRFRLLTSGSRTALRRQQTLRALVDWSYDTLPEAEKTLLRRLSVFAGGWTLEAAEAVGSGEEINPEDILDLLTRVVDKSLVVADQQGGLIPYKLLETIRQYLGEKLLEAGEAEEARRRHAGYYQDLVTKAEPELATYKTAALDRIELQLDNLRAALEWSLDTNPELGLALAVDIGGLWMSRGYTTEGRRWLERFLERVPTRTSLRSAGLSWSSFMAWDQGDGAAARSLGEEALEIARQTGGDREIGMALMVAANQEWTDGNPGRVRALLAECWPLIQNWPGPTGNVLRRLIALDVVDGDLEAAWMKTEQALAIAQATHHLNLIGWTLFDQGGLTQLMGDRSRARTLFEKARATFQDLGDRPGLGLTAGALGYLAGRDSEHLFAEHLFRQSLVTLREIGHSPRLRACLCLLGMLWVQKGQVEAGARLLGATAPAPDAPDANVGLYWRDDFVSAVELARHKLGSDRFAAVWVTGQQTSLDDAVEEALASLKATGEPT